MLRVTYRHSPGSDGGYQTLDQMGRRVAMTRPNQLPSWITWRQKYVALSSSLVYTQRHNKI